MISVFECNRQITKKFKKITKLVNKAHLSILNTSWEAEAPIGNIEANIVQENTRLAQAVADAAAILNKQLGNNSE